MRDNWTHRSDQGHLGPIKMSLVLRVFLCVLNIRWIDDTSSGIYGAHKSTYDDDDDDVFDDENDKEVLGELMIHS